MSDRLVIADDATGALEAGALLAESGYGTVVELEPRWGSGDGPEARVVLLATRHAGPRLAREMIRALCVPDGVALYWKTDSTLRGPIGACFDSLLRTFPDRPLVYCPAYPALGRTVRKGILHVDGLPVSETAFASDPRNPVRNSVIREVISADCRATIRQAEDPARLRSYLLEGSPGVIICDAEREEDLSSLFGACRENLRPLIMAGPAGGIRYWTSGHARDLPPRRWPPAGRWSVICGSQHPVSRAQAKAGEELGLEVMYTPGESRQAAENAPPGMMIFGGDTALAVWRELGITSLVPLGEVLPGVAVSQAGGRLFITKAGGYGEPDLIAKVLERVEFMKPFGITMGDSSGVGPEILLMAASEGQLPQPFVVYGDVAVLEQCATSLGIPVVIRRCLKPDDRQPGLLNVIDHGTLSASDVTPGRINAKSGAAARAYVVAATQAALRGEIAAMVTLPMCKEATQLTDPVFTGHTELIGEICGAADVTIMLASPQLVVTHISTHCSLRQAIERCRKERILKIIELTWEAVRVLKPEARVAVAGLNPHAGENGLFGREEIEEIQPAVQEAQSRGWRVEGPFPPDTLFYMAVRKSRFDAVVCMYHDQGHIPSKLLDFEGGVNIALGLPIIRTSVDHGTAFDIAWQGIASTRSLVQAFHFAAGLAQAPATC